MSERRAQPVRGYVAVTTIKGRDYIVPSTFRQLRKETRATAGTMCRVERAVIALAATPARADAEGEEGR